MNPINFTIDSASLPQFEKQFIQLKKNIDLFGKNKIKCDISEEGVETIKQAFWVNLINCTMLLKLAEIILVKPSLLKKIH